MSDRGGGALWSLGFGPPGPHAVPFDGERIARSGGLRFDALRAAPCVDRGALVDPGPPVATCLAADAICRVVTGASLDLALALAHVAWIAGAPLPADFVASAALSGGRTGPVDRLREKAALVAEEAPAVRRFLVHPSQVDALAGVCGLRAVGVATLADAVRELLPSLERDCAARWRSDPDHARRLAHDLLRAALTGRPALVAWDGVARSADLLGALLGPDARCDLIASIARRHEGSPGDATPTDALPDGWAVPRPLRLRHLAHALQSAADRRDTAAVSRHAERAHDALRADPAERSAEDLVLLGALGRALAACDRDAEAIDALDQAIDGWFALLSPEHASHPLCERVRLAGAHRDRAALERLGPALRDCAAAAVSPTPCFLACAEGRAWALLDEPGRAIERLEASLPWDHAPRHLEDQRRRWLRRLGRPAPRDERTTLDLARES